MSQMQMPNPEHLEADLQKLRCRAYHITEWAEDVLRRYHALRASLKHDSATRLRTLHGWMLVPPTLWPFNIHDVFADCLSTLEKPKPLSKRQCLLIDLLPPPPDEAVCSAVAEHEHQVQKGSYEHLVKTQAKFEQNATAVSSDPELRCQWARIKTEFNVQDFCDHKGVIRRSMGAERNLRPDFHVKASHREAIFRAAFDAFCLRWNLYGMQNDEPLLLKLAVNVTPYGTMIVIPAYWSFDPKRDVRWDAVGRLHRARVAKRQGAAIAEQYAERQKLAEKLPTLDHAASRLNLKGQKKHEFLCAGLGWVADTSPKRISRLRAQFTK